MNVSPKAALGILLGVLLFIMAVQVSRHTATEVEKVAKTGISARKELAMRYVLYQKVATSQFEKDMQPLLANLMKQPNLSSDTTEAIVLLHLMLDAKKEVTQKIIDAYPQMANRALLVFAAGGSDPPAADWERALADDLFGAWLSSAIHQRLGHKPEAINATFRFRAHEAAVAQSVTVQSVISGLTMVGMGLLISMFLSSRRFAQMGQPFFLLPKLILPQAAVFLFIAAYLLANQAVMLGSGFVLTELPGWVQEALSYGVMALIAMVLVQKLLFPPPRAFFFRALGLETLRLVPFSVLQIMGGVMLCLACMTYGQLIGSFLSWPATAGALDLSQLSDSPVAGIVYLLSACILGAILEEIVFRGVVLRCFLSMMRPWKALTLSSALFALTFPLGDWFVGFGMGFALAASHYRSGNLLVNIAIHVVWNGLSLVLIVTGLI